MNSASFSKSSSQQKALATMTASVPAHRPTLPQELMPMSLLALYLAEVIIPKLVKMLLSWTINKKEKKEGVSPWCGS